MRRKIRIGFVVAAGHQSGFFRVYRPLLESLDPKRLRFYLIVDKFSLTPLQEPNHVLGKKLFGSLG